MEIEKKKTFARPQIRRRTRRTQKTASNYHCMGVRYVMHVVLRKEKERTWQSISSCDENKNRRWLYKTCQDAFSRCCCYCCCWRKVAFKGTTWKSGRDGEGQRWGFEQRNANESRTGLLGRANEQTLLRQTFLPLDVMRPSNRARPRPVTPSFPC